MKPQELIVKVQRKADTLGTKINAAEVSRVISLAFGELARLDQAEAFGVLASFAKLAAKHKASAKATKAKGKAKGKAKPKKGPKAKAMKPKAKGKKKVKKKASAPDLTVVAAAALYDLCRGIPSPRFALATGP